MDEYTKEDLQRALLGAARRVDPNFAKTPEQIKFDLIYTRIGTSIGDIVIRNDILEKLKW